MKKPKLKKTLLILSVISIIGIVAISGTDMVDYGGFSVTVENSLVEKYNGNAGAVIDESAARTLIMNENGECAKALYAGIKPEEITYYSALAVTDDAIYLGEYTRFTDSPYVKTERVVKYSLNGKQLKTLFTYTHSSNRDRAINPYINDISVSGKTGKCVFLDVLNKKLYVKSFDAESAGGKFSFKDKSVTTLPATFSGENVIMARFSGSDSDVVIVRGTDNGAGYFRIGENGGSFTAAEADLSKETVVSLNLEGGRVTGDDWCEAEGKTFRYAGIKNVLKVIKWLFMLCILCSAVILTAGTFRKWKREGASGKRLKLSLGALAFLACGFIVIFYSLNMMDISLTEKDDALQGYSSVLYNTAKEELYSCVMDYRENGSIDSEKQEEIGKLFEKNTYAISEAGQNISFSLTAYDNKGNIYCLADSALSSLCGELIENRGDIYKELAEKGVMSSSYDLDGLATNVRIGALYIYDEEGKNIIGALASRSDKKVISSQLLFESLSLFIKLLSAIVTAGFVFVEIKEWIAGVAERRRLKAGRYSHPEVGMTHPFTFMVVMACSVNSVLLAVIAQEMAVESGISGNSVLVALPLTVYSLGYMFGGPVRTVLVRKFNQKIMLLACTAVGMLGYVGCYMSVSGAKLLLFSAALFVTTVFLAAVHSFSHDMSFDAENDEKRIEVNRSVSLAAISATSVAGIVSGFLAKNFGNASIEILGFISTAIVFVMIIVIVPGRKAEKRKGEKTKGKNPEEKGNLRRFLRDAPGIGVLLFISLPVELVYGYKGYVFPLYATDVGMDKALVSSIVVFCTAIAFYSSSAVSSFEKKNGSRKTMLVTVFATAAIFVMFILNHSIMWALAALLAVILALKITEPCVISFWQERAMIKNVQRETASSVSYVVKNAGGALNAPLLGCGLTYLGWVMTCCISGIYLFVNGVIFEGIVRKDKAKERRISGGESCADGSDQSQGNRLRKDDMRAFSGDEGKDGSSGE